MPRGYLVVIILLFSSIACGLLTTSTPTQQQVSPTSQANTTQEATGTSVAEPVGTKTPASGTTGAPTQEEPTKTPYPTSVLDTQLSQQIKEIQNQVVQERGLQPNHPVPVVLLNPDELRKNVTNDWLADYTDEEIADDLTELSIIGLIDPKFDLHGFYIELFSEQIAGYYDSEMGEMFVVKGKGFEGPEHLTYAHEYTHVLQDQNYDLEKGLNMNDESCDKDTERCAAVQALVEGDASLSELNWFQFSASREDQQQVIEFANSYKSPVYDSAPVFLKDDFVFPYNQGLEFVQSFYDQGGWPAVDAIYKNPPVSTEQILHPELYPSDAPINVDLTDLTTGLGDGWREFPHNQMGEWYTFLILARGVDQEARLQDKEAQAAAAGWGGDEYVVLRNDANNLSAFVMKTVWDSAKDADEFAASFQKYADRRFGVKASKQADTLSWSYSGGISTLYLSGDTTIWIIAPDAASAEALAGMTLP